ncbi:hypothetical protein HKB01_02495, partial [Vibrio parahaemolyticus]|nr:hypothetical protein [Vibrio parahaemolyticus]
KKLDDFAKEMATQVNSVHNPGPPHDGYDIFVDIDSSKSISINKDIDKDNSLISAGGTSEIGDGNRALEISKLRNKVLSDGSTIPRKYNDIVTRVGISKQQSDNIVANQEVLLNQLILKR